MHFLLIGAAEAAYAALTMHTDWVKVLFERMNTLFIWSFRMSKKELIIIAVGVLTFLSVAFLLIGTANTRSASANLGHGYSTMADDPQSRTDFLSQFGWNVESEPISVREVTLPSSMDSALSEYNQLQIRQGFDLTDLCGKRVKLWTYSVTNYPVSDEVVANIMTKNGIVVGGDISSLRAGGFTHGFDPVLFSSETAAAQAQEGSVDRSVPDSIPTNDHVPPEQDYDIDEVEQANEPQ